MTVVSVFSFSCWWFLNLKFFCTYVFTRRYESLILKYKQIWKKRLKPITSFITVHRPIFCLLTITKFEEMATLELNSMKNNFERELYVCGFSYGHNTSVHTPNLIKTGPQVCACGRSHMWLKTVEFSYW